MGRNKNKKKKGNNTNNQAVKNTENSVQKVENNIDNLAERNKITSEELEKVTVKQDDIKKDLTHKDAQEVYHKALQIENVLERLKSENEKIKEKLKTEQIELEDSKKDLDSKKQELTERLTFYNKEIKEINKLRVESGWSSIIDKKLIDKYETELKKQEEILINKIEELDKKHTAYISKLSQLHEKENELEDDYQLKIIEEKTRLNKEFKAKTEKKESELEKNNKELEERERKIAKKERELNYEIEDFEEEKKYLENKARNKIKNEIDELKTQIKDLKEKNKALIKELKNIKSELNYLGEFENVEVLKQEFNRYRKRVNELQEQLNTNLDILKVEEYKSLQQEKLNWQDELRKVSADLNDYKRRYQDQKLQIGEKEHLMRENEVLETRTKLLDTRIKELKEEVDELTKQEEGKSTFVSCTEMDEKYKKTDNEKLRTKISENWLLDIQQAIAQVTKNRLYYNDNLLRSFISGLAMSRFSILQGISGTGKTSLPKAFAEAVGGNYGIVEVQSGWKDRQDLIGYYNTFEKKFYEGNFLKYLYMAGTPQYKDKPFFIILDEMNLSHPEHYFADLLSIMEETDEEKQILSISDKVNDMPQLMINLKQGGIGLKIPNNVWFIGTANQDATTKHFAPKTYDRANVIEMPINYEKFKITKIDESKVRIDNSGLLKSFYNAKWDNKKDDKILKYLSGSFKDICADLGIGWGNRLEKQITLFIPVFRLLGGNDAKALDHIISTKILCNIKGRYDLQEPVLSKMKDELKDVFKSKFGEEPTESLNIINDELKKIE